MVGPKGHFCDLENAEVTNGVEHDDWTVKGEWRAVLLALRPRCVTGRGRWGRGRWGVATIVLQGGGHREPGESVPPRAGSPVAKRALS